MNKFLGYAFGFLFGGLILWGAIALHDRKLVEDFKRAQKVAVHDSTETTLAGQSDSVRTVYVDRWHTYTQYRDKVIQANPKDTALRNLAKACNQLIVTCEERQRIDSARISNLQSEVKTLKGITKAKPARVSAFITGGMDFIATQPLIQGGGEVRVMGPLSLTAFLQASGDKVKDTNVKGVIGIRFNFR